MSTLYKQHLKNKTKEQILDEFADEHIPTEKAFGTVIMTLSIKCIQDLEKALKSLEISMNKNAEASNKLSNRVLILNILLGFATIIGTIFTIFGYLGYRFRDFF